MAQREQPQDPDTNLQMAGLLMVKWSTTQSNFLEASTRRSAKSDFRELACKIAFQ
jgi:hypothetical protein